MKKNRIGSLLVLTALVSIVATPLFSRSTGMLFGDTVNVLMNGDFETGTLNGWDKEGQCEASTSIIPIHNDSYSAYVSDATYDSWINQSFYPQSLLHVDDNLWFDGWIYPSRVGSLGNETYPYSAIGLDFYNLSSSEIQYGMAYRWSSCELDQVNSTHGGFFFFFSWNTSQWNLLSRNVTEDFHAVFGNGDFSDIVLHSIIVVYHYSHVSPGDFYADDLKLVDADTDENFLSNGDFETGTLDGWDVGGQCDVRTSSVHGGSYSAYISDLEYDSWIEQVLYWRSLLFVDDGLSFDGWIYPLRVGSLGNITYPSSGIEMNFYNLSSAQLEYSYCYRWSSCELDQVNSTHGGFFFFFSWNTSQWNLLSRNVTEDFHALFGEKNFSDIVLYSIKLYYHYSNVDPGAFCADDLKILAENEIVEIREVTLYPTCPPPYIPSNQARIKEPVLVKVDAAGSVHQAVLKFRKQGEDWFNVSMKFNSTEGLWYQIIPGQSENCTIELFIEAYDNLGFIFVSQTYSYSVKSLPVGDINGDDYVGIDDIFTAASHFGEENP